MEESLNIVNLSKKLKDVGNRFLIPGLLFIATALILNVLNKFATLSVVFSSLSLYCFGRYSAYIDSCSMVLKEIKTISGKENE